MLAIVSAIEDEIKPLIAKLDLQSDAGKVWRHNQSKLLISPVGVGFLEAALGLTELLSRYPEISSVLFCGTAGVFARDDKISIGELCLCKETVLVDGAAEMGYTKYAQFMKNLMIPSNLVLDLELPSVRVATCLTITSSDELAGRIKKNQKPALENMELFGIGTVCLKNKLNWNAMLGVTNQVGSSGHQQWKQHKKVVVAHLADQLEEWIKKKK